MRRLAILAIIMFLAAGRAYAQTSTPTPTFTPTPTPSPTSTPDTRSLIPVGAIQLWAGNSTPAGWLVCDGSCVDRGTYSALFAAINETFGACDGVTTFGLPDLRGRVPVGAGDGTGLTVRAPGQTFGEETHLLTIAEMPAHTHPVDRYLSANPYTGGTARYAAQSGSGVYNSGSTGGGLAHNVIQPSIVVNYLIWTGTEPLSLPGYDDGGQPLPTATPMPEIAVYSTVEVNGVGQPVAFSYSVSAGDFMLSILLFFLCGLVALNMVLRARKEKPS